MVPTQHIVITYFCALCSCQSGFPGTIYIPGFSHFSLYLDVTLNTFIFLNPKPNILYFSFFLLLFLLLLSLFTLMSFFLFLPFFFHVSVKMNDHFTSYSKYRRYNNDEIRECFYQHECGEDIIWNILINIIFW